MEVKVSTFQLYKAKKIAFKMIQGGVQEQFTKLHDYIAELKKANPGTTVALQGDALFQIIYFFKFMKVQFSAFSDMLDKIKGQVLIF